MTDKSDRERSVQGSQDDEYCFPYHYISEMPNRGVVQHVVDSWGINSVSAVEFMLGEIEKLEPRSVIDIGCGDGRLTREIYNRFGDRRVVGADYSTRAIALARAMNQNAPALTFERIDISAEDFDEPFDVAILMEVYEHIPIDQTGAFLAGVRRALRPGGTLLLTVPHVNKPLEYKHFQHFTLESLTRDLSAHFSIVAVRPFERRSILRGIVNRLLCNRLFVLNHRGFLDRIYRLYAKRLFNCESETECQRIFVKAVTK